MNNRLGCFSATAIISAIITALVIASVAIASGSSMFSPGKLNAIPGDSTGGVISHAQIGKECGKCHTAFWQSERMSDRCVICHSDITQQIAQPLTLHGILNENNSSMDCRNCHPEHRGATSSLTDFTSDFPHEQLGFSLAAHPDSRCVDCHDGVYTSFNTGTCTTCHQQEELVFTTAHVISFGDDCLACHDGRELLGKDFNHASTRFPLTGLHKDLICTECHLNARSISDLQNTPDQCINCHSKDETHDGRFGTSCDVCHETLGWKPAKFDHDLAYFKLTGKHVAATCEDCHTDGAYQGTPSTCGSCHAEEDDHQGQFGSDCGLCHSTNEWEPATFDHTLSIFKLTGAHLTVDCNQCHQNDAFNENSCHLLCLPCLRR